VRRRVMRGTAQKHRMFPERVRCSSVDMVRNEDGEK
jgi:hypothetical protein